MKLKLLIIILFCSVIGFGQCVENFENLPTFSPGAYLTRSWIGTDGVTWTADSSRTDQTLTSRAICTNGSGNVLSLTYAGGMGNLSFNYVRGFTSTAARSIEVWDNGAQIGTTITVSPTSNTVVNYNQPLNIGGNVVLELRTSGAQIEIDDISWTSFLACKPPAISSVFPTSGSEGTEVTINASSVSLIGATASFGGIAAIPVSNSASQLVVKVPNGASSGNIIITDAQPCTASTPFTVIDRDISSCEGVTPIPSDLIIYEIHDEKAGSGGTITLFNETGTAVNLSNYSLYRTTNQNDGNEINYATLTGTIPSGALRIITVSSTLCGPVSTNGTITGGFNQNDGIQLRDAAGVVIIDDVDAYIPAAGYYVKRNAGSFIPRASYILTDWTTITLGAGACASGLGTTPTVTGSGNVPSISAQPTLVLSCTSIATSICVTRVEGFTGGNPLAYQWFEVAPNTTTSTSLADVGIYIGSATNILNISSVGGLNEYQYYCQVRENTATCYVASVAVKINTGTTTWNGTTWNKGAPTLSKAAIIDGNYDTSTHGSFSACSLIINATFSLVVTSNNYIEIENDITNNGVLDVLNNGSLIQVRNTATNTGNISMSRIAKIRLLDYVYWSSPVASFTLASVSAATPANYFWSWNANVSNPNGGQGNWEAASGNMLIRKGYAVREPNGWNAATPTGYNTNYEYTIV